MFKWIRDLMADTKNLSTEIRETMRDPNTDEVFVFLTNLFHGKQIKVYKNSAIENCYSLSCKDDDGEYRVHMYGGGDDVWGGKFNQVASWDIVISFREHGEEIQITPDIDGEPGITVPRHDIEPIALFGRRKASTRVLDLVMEHGMAGAIEEHKKRLEIKSKYL